MKDMTLKVFPSILSNLNLMLFTCKRIFSFHRWSNDFSQRKSFVVKRSLNR